MLYSEIYDGYSKRRLKINWTFTEVNVIRTLSMLKNSGWLTGHRWVLKTQNLQTSEMEKSLSGHRRSCLRLRMFVLSSFMQIPGWQLRSRPLPSTFFSVHYSSVIVPFHDIYSDTQTASLNKHSISYKRNDRPSAVTGTLWSLPWAIGWNSWSSNCVGDNARAVIDILAHTHYFDSKFSVIMNINILLKHVSGLSN